uniref:Uncharacterized protein n=1 Tax=Alexandrium monilatum TaxID=311494 RepID=A0A6T1A4X1_9DINO
MPAAAHTAGPGAQNPANPAWRSGAAPAGDEAVMGGTVTWWPARTVGSWSMETSNLSWACSPQGLAGAVAVSAAGCQLQAELPCLRAQDPSNLVWPPVSAAVERPRPLAAAAAGALCDLAVHDTQATTSVAQAPDVTRDEAALDGYLDAAFAHFAETATPTPRTSGMSWVELGSAALARPTLPGAPVLAARFGDELGRPVLALLKSLASPASHAEPGQNHGAAFRMLADYAPRHRVPHLGLPFTRRALANLGVALHQPSSAGEYPSAELREECWLVGIW